MVKKPSFNPGMMARKTQTQISRPQQSKSLEKEKDLNKLFAMQCPLKPKDPPASPKRLEVLLGKNSSLMNLKNKEEIPLKTKKKEVINIISSSEDEVPPNKEKPILFDPDQEQEESIEKPEFRSKTLSNLVTKPKTIENPIKEDSFMKTLEKEKEKDPLYSLFQGRFKFNKSHSKTFIELFTTSVPQNFQIPPFPYKNPEKPKLITSGTTNIQSFIRFYFQNQVSNPRDMLMGWLESLDENSDRNLEILAEELGNRQEITGLKFGARNSASIHFMSIGQLDQFEYLADLKRKMVIWTKKSTIIRMVFLITVNSDLLEKKEEKLDFLKVLKGVDWELKRLSDIEQKDQRGIRREIEEMMDEEEKDEFEEDEEEEERILRLFGKKKRKI